MPSEADLEKALMSLLTMLDDLMLTAGLVAWAFGQRSELDMTLVERLREIRSRADGVEALAVTILNRGGLSWDAMAGAYGVSKQSLHRRLAGDGEWAYEQAQNYVSFHASDVAVLEAFLDQGKGEARRIVRRASTELNRRAKEPRLWHTPVA